MRDIQATLKNGRRVTLALNVWQRMLHMCWQFRDLTFSQITVHSNTPLESSEEGNSLDKDHISDLFLRQFDLRHNASAF